MLAARGKAAVVHPTGTGKSFIAFKLAEDNPSSPCLVAVAERIHFPHTDGKPEKSL